MKKSWHVNCFYKGVKILVENFGISGITTVDEDLAKFNLL